MEVVATAGTVAAALALPEDPAPDVCAAGPPLPDGDGVTLRLALRERWSCTKLLILTMTHEPATVLRSLAAGVDNYLVKDAPPEALLGAIRATAAGSVVLSAGASASVRVAASAVPSADALDRLDARDREILGLLAQGLSTHQVAGRVFLAPKTCATASRRCSPRSVATREDAIAIALAGGLGR